MFGCCSKYFIIFLGKDRYVSVPEKKKKKKKRQKKKGVFKHVYFLCTFFYLSDSLINKHVKFIAAEGCWCFVPSWELRCAAVVALPIPGADGRR